MTAWQASRAFKDVATMKGRTISGNTIVFPILGVSVSAGDIEAQPEERTLRAAGAGEVSGAQAASPFSTGGSTQ